MVNMRYITLFLLKLLILSTLLKPIYDFPSNIIGLGFDPVHKALSISVVAWFLLLIVREQKIRYDGLIFLFSTGLFLAMMSGIYNGEMFVNLGIAASQTFYFLMPTICLGVGAILCRSVLKEVDIFIKAIAPKLFFFLVALVPLYHFFHSVIGVWDYYGYSSGLVFVYALMYRSSNSGGIVGVLADLTSGKRSSVLMWLLVFAIRKPRILLLIVGLVALVFLFFVDEIVPKRYLDVFNFDIADEYAMFYATGGRSTEWIGIIDKFRASPEYLFSGFGLGSSYEMFDIINKDWETRHYSHFTPFSYFLVAGFVFTFAIYIAFFVYVYRCRVSRYSNLWLYMTVMFCLSLSGASLLAEPLPWIFLGMLSHKDNVEKKMSR